MVGDVILRINDTQTRTVTEVQRAVRNAGELIVVVVHRDGGEHLLTIPLD